MIQLFYLLGLIRAKAPGDRRSPKPAGMLKGSLAPRGFGLRLSSGAFRIRAIATPSLKRHKMNRTKMRVWAQYLSNDRVAHHSVLNNLVPGFMCRELVL
jgi:hypothetical protein